jgi:hypothetical protein
LPVKLGVVCTFSREAIASWAREKPRPGCYTRGDGLVCFAGVIDAGCAQSYVVVGSHKPRELRQLIWVNTVLIKLKTVVGGAHLWFRVRKHAQHCLGVFAYRFNSRCNLGAMLNVLIGQAATIGPTRERQVRGTAEFHE